MNLLMMTVKKPLPDVDLGMKRAVVSVAPLLVDIQSVCRATSFSESHIRNLMDRGDFPKPQTVHGKKVWKWSTVTSWVEEQIGE